MRITQKRWDLADIAQAEYNELATGDPQLVLIFGSRQALQHVNRDYLSNILKSAIIIGCSTSGEIHGTEVTDDTLSMTAITFEKTTVVAHSVSCSKISHSADAGKELAAKFNTTGLKHILVLSEGLTINGSALVAQLIAGLPTDVSVSGGLSGDGPFFEKTELIFGTQLEPHLVCAVGFYGDSIEINCSSMGGWDPFGPERKITQSKGNILFELDGEPALDLYKRYLGDMAQELPASGLLFPLTIKSSEENVPIVRTLLAVNETNKSLTFAGDIPAGASARLMKANFDRLIEGAMNAASEVKKLPSSKPPAFALLISCVGRKLILKQRIEEEIEGVRDVFGPTTALAGFYSYGEISPSGVQQKCELHNQTMTITTFDEK